MKKVASLFQGEEVELGVKGFDDGFEGLTINAAIGIGFAELIFEALLVDLGRWTMLKVSRLELLRPLRDLIGIFHFDRISPRTAIG